MIKIAKELSEWKIVGMCLGFSDGEITTIETNHNNEAERRVYFVDAWLKKCGDEATYHKLLEVLISNERNDLVDDTLKFLDKGEQLIVCISCSPIHLHYRKEKARRRTIH